MPKLLLTLAVRRMPADRGDWGAAMLAELAQLQHPATRWQFALGCTCVALFPPGQGGLMNNTIKTITTNSRAAALVGLLFIVPFALLNTIVANRIEPFFSLIRPGIHTSPLEYILLPIVLLLLPVGAFIAIRPMLRKGADVKRKLYLVNCTLATLLVIVFVLLSVGLGSDIYRCDILQIPNCD
jgi:hypothetical protein